ncbi:MAG: hypothetical protein ACQETD_10210 [Pseudomonadota bacterium]
MAVLVRVVWQIALLRQGPQVLPAASVLLWLSLGAHWLTGVLLGLFTLPPELAMLSALVGTLIMVALVHALLVLHRKQSRVVQTLTALAACETLLGLIAMPLSALFYAGGDIGAIAGMFSLLLLGWNIAIAAHIFRHALAVSMGVGVLLAVGYTLVAISLGSYIVPAQG